MSSPALTVLLGVLDRTRSPRTRLEALLTATKAIRRMSGEERTRLAVALGLQGGAELIEHLAEGEPEVRDAMLVALKRAGDADPRELVQMLRELADPQRRRAAVRHGVEAGLDRARRELVETLAPPPAPVPPAAPRESAPAIPATPAPVAPRPTPAPAASVAAAFVKAATPPAPAPVPVARPAPEPRRAADVPPAPNAQAGPPPGEAPTRAAPAAPAAGTRVSWRAAATSARDRDATRPQQRRRRTRAPAPGLSLAERLDGAASLVERFRVLRRGLGLLEAAAAADLRAALERFPDGWPRRRALWICLQAGIPASTEDALGLLSALSRPADRRWCERSLRAWRGVASPLPAD